MNSTLQNDDYEDERHVSISVSVSVSLKKKSLKRTRKDVKSVCVVCVKSIHTRYMSLDTKSRELRLSSLVLNEELNEHNLKEREISFEEIRYILAMHVLLYHERFSRILSNTQTKYTE